MYAGHLGFALGAYSFRRQIPLWLLLFAAQFPDWMDVGLCVLDIGRGPFGLYSHGLHALTVSAFSLAILYVLFKRDLIGGFIVVITVLSHYGLDYFTGLKPTWAGGPLIGLMLYQRPVIDLLLESCTIFIGWMLYRRTIPSASRNHITVYGILVALIIFQIIAGIAFYFDMGGGTKC